MNLRVTINKYKPKIRTFFSTFPWKNAITFLFFTFFAFIFWMMLFFQQEGIEGTYTIPLKYTNVPEDIVFDNTLPDKIEIFVSDKGSEIFRYDIRKRDTLEINVGDYINDNVEILQGGTYNQLIRSRLFPTTELVQYSPPTISIEVSKLESKELQVVFDGEITTNNASLVVDTITFLPEKVMAYSSQSKLNKLEEAVTDYSVFENLKATSQLKIKIKPIEGVKFVPSLVDVYIPIEEFTEKTFEIPIQCKNLPDNMEVKFFPSKVEVTFSVTLEEYRKIDPEDFKIVMDYNELNKLQDSSVNLQLTTIPKNVRNVHYSPTSAEFLFEKK